MATLKSVRDKEVYAFVKQQLSLYFSGVRRRRCASCGLSIVPRNRYNFFCGTDCRNQWYKGQFMPKKKED